MLFLQIVMVILLIVIVILMSYLFIDAVKSLLEEEKEDD